jgi:leucyl-tRNA synthetase
MANGEIWVCTLRAARNMSYQGLMAKEGDTATLLTLTGQDILGLPLAAPLAHYTTIYTLPMLTIKVVNSLLCLLSACLLGILCNLIFLF